MRMPLAGRGVAALAALLLLAAAAQAQVMAPGAMAPAMAPATPQPLPPFSAIVLCVPFNVLIAPGDYSLTVDAEPAVASAIQGNVTRGVLALQTASFSTNQPINVTINLPADRLGSLAHYGVLSSVWVNPGFRVGTFNLTTGFGSGGVYVNGLMADNVTASLAGMGPVYLAGEFGTVGVRTPGGITSVFIDGAVNEVNLVMAGITSVYVTGGPPSLVISGAGTGISNVRYTAGTCQVAGVTLLMTPCQQVPGINLQPPPVTWTSGLTAIGPFTCAFGTAVGAAVTAAPLFPAAGAAPGAEAAPVPTAEALPMAPVPEVPVLVPGVETRGVAPTSPSTNLQQPSPFYFGAPAPGGFQQQAGAVTPGGSTAGSSVAGQGPVSASSTAGPGTSITSTGAGGVQTTYGITG